VPLHRCRTAREDWRRVVCNQDISSPQPSCTFLMRAMTIVLTRFYASIACQSLPAVSIDQLHEVYRQQRITSSSYHHDGYHLTQHVMTQSTIYQQHPA